MHNYKLEYQPQQRSDEDIKLENLAYSVIERAMNDALGRGVHGGNHRANIKPIIASAREFLDNSSELRTWCALAGISVRKVLEIYKRAQAIAV